MKQLNNKQKQRGVSTAPKTRRIKMNMYEKTEQYDIQDLIVLEDILSVCKEKLEELQREYSGVLQYGWGDASKIRDDIDAYESSMQNARRQATKALIKYRELHYYVDDEFPCLQVILRRVQAMNP